MVDELEVEESAEASAETVGEDSEQPESEQPEQGAADEAPAAAAEEGSSPATTQVESDGDPVVEDATHEASNEDGEADVDGEDAGSTRLGPGAHLTDDELRRRLTALLFASPEPLSLGRLVALLERPQRPRVKAAIEALDGAFEGADLPFQVRGLKGGYTLMSTPDVGPVLARLAKGAAVERVSAAALETLSVVAYRQPVTKAEIEAIRGVQAGPILRSLVDRGLIKVSGRADVPGHPLQYATTKDFLDRFGLMNLDDLPRDAELTQD